MKGEEVYSTGNTSFYKMSEKDLLKYVDTLLDLGTLKEKKHILIVRSAKVKFYNEFVNNLNVINSNIRISLLGDDSDVGSPELEKIEKLYIHHLRIDDKYTKEFLDEIKNEDFDAVVFLTYSPVRLSYANIISLCEGVSSLLDIPVYSYLVNNKTLNYYRDISSVKSGLDQITNGSKATSVETASVKTESADEQSTLHRICFSRPNPERKYRILICNERFLFRFGVDRVLLLLGSYWKATGHEIIMMGNRLDERIVEKCADRFIYIPEAPNYIQSNEFALSYMQQHWNEWFDESNVPDVALVAGWPYYSSLGFLKEKCGCAIFQDYGAVPIEGMNEGSKAVQYELRRLRKLYLRDASRIVAISKFLLDTQSTVDVDNLISSSFVHIGVDHMDISLWDKADIGNAEQNSVINYIEKYKQSGYKILFFPGRWENSNYKNSKASIGVIRVLKEAGLKVKVLVLSSLSEMGDIPEDVKDDFLCMGYADDDTMRHAMELSDAGFAMTLWEGFDLPLGEMQYLGTPMFVFNIGAHPEVVADPYFLCKDSEEMAQKIIDCLNGDMPFDDEQLKKILSDYKKVFTWENTARQLMGQIEETIDDNRLAVIVDVTNACRDTANSGVMRVTRKLTHYLQRRMNTIFVMWDESIGEYVFPNSDEIYRLSSYGGPIAERIQFVSKTDSGRTRLQEILPMLDGASKVLLFTETVNYKQMQLATAFIHSIGGYVATIFYDAIAVLRPELCNPEVSANHKKYMKELSCCDLIVPIEYHNELDLKKFWEDCSIESTLVKTISLAAEMDGVPRNTNKIEHIENKKKKILFVSTLEPRKNHIRLLSAVEQLMEEHGELRDKFELTLVGNRYAGNTEIPDFVESVCSRNHNIHWLGVVDDVCLRKLYEECDFTVYPSEIEGFGMPLIESLWFGKPCVCNCNGSLGDLAAPGGCYAVDVLNVDEIKSALFDLITNDDMYLNLQHEATERKITTWQDYSDSLIHELLKMVENKPQACILPAEIRKHLTEYFEGEYSDRIVQISNYYPPTFLGGAEIIAFNQAKAMKEKANANVMAIVCDFTDKFTHRTLYCQDVEGVLVLRVCMAPQQDGIDFYNEYFNKVFDSVCDLIDPTVIHGHNIIQTSLGVIDIAKQRGIKVFLTLHDCWGFCLKNTMLDETGKLCSNVGHCENCRPFIRCAGKKIPTTQKMNYQKRILNEVDGFISPSRYLAEQYINAGFDKEKMHVIWNGIDVERFTKIQKKLSNKIRITFIGVFAEHKGLDLLIKAVAKLDSDNVVLNIVGDGELFLQYVQLAKNLNVLKHIKFWGKIPNEQIGDVYEETDIFCLPSIWPENQPVSITEAMICGIPVVATNLGGNSELIVDGQSGYLFNANDFNDLADKLDRLVKDEKLRARFGKAAKERMLEHSFGNQVDLIMELYKSTYNQSASTNASFVIKGFGSDLVKTENADAIQLDWLPLGYDLKNVIACLVMPNYSLTFSEKEFLNQRNIPILYL